MMHHSSVLDGNRLNGTIPESYNRTWRVLYGFFFISCVLFELADIEDIFALEHYLPTVIFVTMNWSAL
jgi:hypothetical protein